MQTLTAAENSNAELKKKLATEEQARKSADSVLEGAERQAESRHVRPMTSWLLPRSN